MNNPVDGNNEHDPFESDHARWEAERLERERLEAERLEAERLAAERGDADEAHYEEGEFSDHAAEQLRLSDEEERLPWLEADDDFADDAVDTARIATVAVLGLLAVLAVVALAWWLSRDKPDAALQADGSTIAAPDGAIRERPENPGGQPVDGTGDVSYEVGQGRDGPTQVASGAGTAPAPTATATASATPSIDRAQAGSAPAATATATATTTTGAASAASGGGAVQVGAYSSNASAEAGWNQLARQNSALQGVGHRIVAATVDGNSVFRLQALAGNAAAAQQLCRAIKSGGGDCRVVN